MQIATYAQTLRALGQALEAARCETFNLRSVGETYHIRGEQVVEVQPTPQAQHSSFWQKLKGNAAQEAAQPQLLLKEMELDYTASNIEQIEREGQARRRDPHGMPDAYSPSQVLRAAGAYLDQKRAKLQELSKKNGSIKLRYETPFSATTEELTVPYLYDMAVRMYLRRHDRGATEEVAE